MGLLRKLPNPQDRRGALLSLKHAARVKMDQLIQEIRTVNDLFFGRLDTHSFSELFAGARALVQGSREAVHFAERTKESSL